MSKYITILKDCAVLNTVVDPAKLGPEDLQYALDVRISDHKRLDRVDGHSLATAMTGGGHSLFCDGGACLIGWTTSLYLVNGNNTLTGLRSGMSGQPMCFAQHGAETYYGNGTQVGIVRDGASYVWPVGTYSGVRTTKQFETEIPPFKHLAFHAGRLFGAVGNTIFQSEVGEYGLFDLSVSFSLATDIRMICPVDGGIFASDGKETCFLAGTSIEEFRYRMVAPYPAIEYAVSPPKTGKVEGIDIGLVEPGLCAVWLSEKGLCLGTPAGAMFNLTDRRIIYPMPGAAGAVLKRGFSIIAVLESSFCTETNLKVGEVTGSKATTNRSHFAFNSFCKRGNDYLAAGSAGLYLLGGNTHNGTAITGEAETFLTDFEHNGHSKMRTWVMGLEADGPLTITPTADDTQGVEHPAATITAKTGQQTRYGKFRSDMKGRYWKFLIKGSIDFSIDHFEVQPLPLKPGRSGY